MYCVSCGQQIPEGVRFCPVCGNPVGVAPAAGSKNIGDYVKNATTNVVDSINQMAGGTGHVDLKFSNFFDSVTQHHTSEEADELFACGSPSTTPALKDVVSDWPHPWVWSRVLLVLLVFVVFAISMIQMGFNEIGELMFMGSIATPLAALVFFYETNVFRNISIAQVMKFFILGGALSLLADAIILQLMPSVSGTGDIIPSLFTGLFEEAAKFLATGFFLSRRKGRVTILNGLLIGAAVGAGFAAFETIGYVLQAFTYDLLVVFLSDDTVLSLFNYDVMSGALVADVYAYEVGMTTGTIFVRGVLAFGGHVAWAAIEGGALALVETDEGFQWADLANTRFLKFAAISIVLHGIWDMTVPGLDDIDWGVLGGPKYYLLIIAVWVVLYVLLNRGLQQANDMSQQAQVAVQAAVRYPVATMDQAAYAAPAQAQPQVQVQPQSQVQPQAPASLVCPDCGANLAPGAHFCPFCGHRF